MHYLKSKNGNTYLLLVIFSCIFFIASCATKLYIPSEANVSADVSLTDLQKGRKIYTNKCSNCHDLHLPHEYNHDEWIEKVNKMQARSFVDDESKNLILLYLWNAPPAKKK